MKNKHFKKRTCILRLFSGQPADEQNFKTTKNQPKQKKKQTKKKTLKTNVLIIRAKEKKTLFCSDT